MLMADILIELLQKPDNKKAQSQLMAVLPDFLRIEQKSSQFMKFLSKDVHEEDIDEETQEYHTFEFKMQKDGLPRFSDTQLAVSTWTIS